MPVILGVEWPPPPPPIKPAFDVRAIHIDAARALVEEHHGYKGMGKTAVYAFGVIESGRVVAAYVWQPPPPGSAEDVCPEAPSGVLALSRMVAVPKDARRLKHISRPLEVQMKRLIDRSRWPVLVTYHDEGQGHNGFVYRCSGWEATEVNETETWERDGVRISRYSNGERADLEGAIKGKTTIHRWEHWICPRGQAAEWMRLHGWSRVPVPGKTWRSGNQAYTWQQASPQIAMFG